MAAAMASMTLCVVLLMLSATGTTAQPMMEGCPQNTLGNLNSIIATVDNNDKLMILKLDILLARISFQGCSVFEAFKNLPVNLALYYGPNPNDNVAVPLGSGKQLLDNKNFKKENCIAIYIFGYRNSPDNLITRAVIKEMVAANKFNVVLLNWAPGSEENYEVAVDLVELMAVKLAQDLKNMLDAEASICFVAGHGLGAQMTGTVSRNLKALGYPMPCAIALDPFAALFEGTMYGCGQKLQKGDADHVIVVHSDKCGLGSSETHGDVDIHINRGYHGQPQCPDDTYDSLGTPIGVCSHNLAPRFFYEALASGSGTPVRQCESWEDFTSGACDNKELIYFPDCSRGNGTYYYNMTT